MIFKVSIDYEERNRKAGSYYFDPAIGEAFYWALEGCNSITARGALVDFLACIIEYQSGGTEEDLKVINALLMLAPWPYYSKDKAADAINARMSEIEGDSWTEISPTYGESDD